MTTRIFSYTTFCLLICIGIFLVLSFWDVMRLGYFYDELLHAVTAQKLLIGGGYRSQGRELVSIFVGSSFFPIASLHYLGQLRAYVMWPFFSIFGDSLWSVRMFSIGCGVIFLLLIYVWIRRNFSRKIALVATFLMSIDPSHVLYSRYDYGPVALQNILKMLLIVIFYELQKRKSVGLVFVFGLLSGLIIWDKLIAVWIVLPLIVLLLVGYRQRCWQEGLAGSFGLLIGSVPVGYFIWQFAFFSKSGEAIQKIATGSGGRLGGAVWLDWVYDLIYKIFEYFVAKIITFYQTLAGVSGVNYFILNHPIVGGVFGIVFLLTLGLLAWNFWLGRLRNEQELKSAVWIFLLGFLCILVTPYAHWGHHMFILWPLPQLLVGYVLVTAFRPRLQALVLSIVFISQLLVLYSFHNHLDDVKYTWGQSDKEYLYEYFKRKSEGDILAIDWGISLPLGFISRGSLPISDLEGLFRPKCTIIEQFVHPERQVLVLYSRNWEKLVSYYQECDSPFSKYSFDRETVGEFLLLRKAKAN